MAIELYSTAAQLKAIEMMPQEYTFLYDTFCKDGGVVEDDTAIYDYRKGAAKMAPFVSENVGGVVMQRSGFDTRKIGFCTIAPERMIDLSDIKTRAFSEEILGSMTPEQRAKKMQANDIMEMRKAIQRRREWMARQVLLTGKLSVFRYTNEGRDIATTLYADYGFTNTFTPTNAWNTSSATIDKDMESIFDLVVDGLGTVDIIVMAPDVAHAMMENSKFMQKRDMLNVNVGEINTKYRGQGVRALGYSADGVEMYSFAGKFTDDDGTVKPILPSGTLIAGSRGIINCIHGPVTIVEGSDSNAAFKTYIKKEVPQRIGGSEANSIKNRLTSRPTIVPWNVDAWVVANVL